MQTNGQRRFTVVELPVFPIVMESLLMPFRYLPELAKFGWIPFAAILAIDLICYALLREDVSRSVTSSLMTLAHFVLFTPFSVAWTKLAVRGPQAVSKHPQFFYSRTQWFYLLAGAAMMVALLVLVGIPFVVVRYGQRNFESQITLLGETGMMLGIGLYVIGYVRLAFVFPAIAIGRYAGIRAAWRQTAGNIERLAAIIVLTLLPYWIVRQAFSWYMGYHPPGVIEAFRGCIDMLLIALATTALAGPALAYKSIVMDQPQADPAAQSITAAR
ncbi:MAG: hypothetical protein WCD12_14840 [Candidatus Binatus sp.]|uniref:hypothetical protein n=1 Tax=Candidatus Binatus sp. TaxID=2811406 RepID=UPI003C707BB2